MIELSVWVFGVLCALAFVGVLGLVGFALILAVAVKKNLVFDNRGQRG